MSKLIIYSDFELVHFLDRDSFTEKEYRLSDDQFKEVVARFQKRMEKNEKLF